MNKIGPQREMYKSAFAEMRVNISAEDRKAAIDHLQTTRATISRYINGDIRSLTTANKLLKFLGTRINERTAEINAIRV
ncbi:hypothetical protein [Foetidibacter luteolus]|uniref:hypothetical protein n=1 Tax=Foetidibacter luteolus TaxID=2608880 RepID=UPI00129B0C56|nr:hypothetical protein [Foetidibacter luteolus]